ARRGAPGAAPAAPRGGPRWPPRRPLPSATPQLARRPGQGAGDQRRGRPARADIPGLGAAYVAAGLVAARDGRLDRIRAAALGRRPGPDPPALPALAPPAAGAAGGRPPCAGCARWRERAFSARARGEREDLGVER